MQKPDYIDKFESYQIVKYQLLDSTNLQAKNYIDNNASNNLVIIADNQTSGRGRETRQWESIEGNLMFSIIEKSNVEDYRFFSLIASHSFCELLTKYNIKAEIKWPNDLLIDGKKICGILPELYKNHLILGIGFNLVEAPVLSHKKTTCLADYKINISADIFFKDFLKIFSVELKKFKNNKTAFIQEISEQLQKSENICFSFGGKKYEGKFKNIDINGNIVLIINGEEKIFSAGEILDL